MTLIRSILIKCIIVGALFFVYTMEVSATQKPSTNGSVECFNSGTGQITTEVSQKACNKIINH